MQSHNFRKKSLLWKSDDYYSWFVFSHDKYMQFIIFIIDYFENFYKIQTQNMSTSGKKESS